MKRISFGSDHDAVDEAAFAIKNVPFFRGLGYSDIQSIEEMPFTVKSDYRNNFPFNILADGKSVNDPYVVRFQSSGTSGDRLVTVMYMFTLASRMSNCIKINPSFEFLNDISKIRTCRYAAPNCSDVECANPRVSREDRTLEDGTLVLPVYHDLLTTPADMFQIAANELIEYEPHIWYVDPMHLVTLYREIGQSSWEFNPSYDFGVLLTYTYATQILKDRLKKYLDDIAPVASVMAMSEFGYVGMECEKGSLHLNDLDYYLEFIEDEETYGLSELVVTSVGDRLLPHIRYKTNDLYEIVDCTCGCSMPAVKFHGRKKDVVSLQNGSFITPAILDECIGLNEYIDFYQLTKEGKSWVLLYKLAPNNDLPTKNEIKLLNNLVQLLDDKSVKLKCVDYFPFERGGKFQTISL